MGFNVVLLNAMNCIKLILSDSVIIIFIIKDNKSNKISLNELIVFYTNFCVTFNSNSNMNIC